MKEEIKKMIQILSGQNKTIATMESCTGGALVNQITNVEGASDIIKFSAVTYSNAYKIKMGVPKEIIDTYSVYSIKTAQEMSKQISYYADADYGIGITGKLNRLDKNNPGGECNIVYISIYEKDFQKYNTFTVEVNRASREENKQLVVSTTISMLLQIILEQS